MVTGDHETEEEIGLRVLDRNLGVSVYVQLFPEDLDWAKDCHCSEDPCHHVAAALIVLKKSKGVGQKLPQSKSAAGKMVYIFKRTEHGLSLRRMIETDGRREELSTRLTKDNVSRTDLNVSATKQDLAIDIALGAHGQGITPQDIIPKIARFMKEIPSKPFLKTIRFRSTLKSSVWLRRSRIKVLESSSRHLWTKESRRVLKMDGLWSTASSIPFVPSSFTIKNFRCSKMARCLASKSWESFSGEMIPFLRKKNIFIDNQSRNLPDVVRERPRLEIDLQKIGARLQVTPIIAYGNPTSSEIRFGELKSIDGKVPVRDFDRERQLQDQCYRDLHLDLQKSVYYEGESAVHFVQKLKEWKGEKKGNGLPAFSLHAPIQSTLQIDGNQFELDFSSSDSDGKTRKANSGAIIAAWERGESLVPLLDGGWAPLPTDWLQKYGRQIKELLMAKADKESLPKAALPSLAKLASDVGTEISLS